MVTSRDPDTATICFTDHAPLQDVPPKLNGAERQQRQRPPKMEPKRDERIPIASFSCFLCGGGLRIRLPEVDAGFRCPQCQAEFRVTKTADSPLVFLVVPDLSQFSRRAPSASRSSERKIPREVSVALTVFGLAESVSFDDVRRAYRELVQSYHPDKVAHLGPDLRRVAETKTKELNSAYNVLETFYAA